MALFFVERIKEQFGKDKEALELYEQVTGKKVSQLYADAFRGDNTQTVQTSTLMVQRRLFVK